MSKLSDLTQEQKLEICAKHLDNYSLSEVERYVSDKFNVTYTRQTYNNFFKSREGLEMIDEVAKSIREKWINEPLAEKSSRIHALQEQATKLQRILRNFPKEAVGSSEFYKVSQELRAYLNQLRQETEPLRLQKDEKLLSPLEWLFTEEVDAKQTPEVRPEGTEREEKDSLSKVRIHPSYKATGDSL